jgi:ADP-ribosylglycohydrolase
VENSSENDLPITSALDHVTNGGTDELSRARGALYGLAIGDALGMPTQMMSRDEVVSVFGALLVDFEPAPSDHPIAEGMSAGRITDDTEQAILLAAQLIDGDGEVDIHNWANALIAWEEAMKAKGSLDLLGPSTKRAISALVAGGDPEEVGSRGDTNGAAMRITPVGIAVKSVDLNQLVARVAQASRLTHNTNVALAGAAAVAAAVSEGIEGSPIDVMINRACDAAVLGSRRGHWIAGADVALRIRWAIDLVHGLDAESVVNLLPILVGTSLETWESVPAAFAVASAFSDDPWLACRVAASLGGDSDTIAAMTGAIVGALGGVDVFPLVARETVSRVNELDLDSMAQQLLSLRTRHEQTAA